ncbi:MerR family transcriptional regulator [Nocardia sp. CDC159]|uniref:MerR family transcriptional regulator n=1 Tax=Nocardia pulmonis TaxID=2951408 RepID=A0A9X2E3D5_9NOCA|nr:MULTISPECIES: MerR family transcriptional regulator [Nocardia]MCM6773517.1 MerR family transcriptional regulator [Nocardia pulmonis]MCM6786404.1 MerR family transcriptional regulator [Nocardia sp. CDC159]
MGTTEQRYLRIGAVAERTELSIKTIRHYDEVGLVTPSARSSGGFRLYTSADIDRLLIIRSMKPLGYSLDQMRRLLESLDLLADTATTPGQRAQAAAYVSECRTLAEDSCAKLRRHLAHAEEFTELLARHG